MQRLKLFVKGNVDVHDSLHSCRIDGTLLWNGLNEVLRSRYPGALARIRHETFTRSDALRECTGVVPSEVAARDLNLGPYPANSQFSRAIFETPADAVVLTLQPDIMSRMVRHRRDGYLLYPNDTARWPAEDKDWLSSCFEQVPLLGVDESMANLEAIIAELNAVHETPIVIYNVSAIIPGESIHCYAGLDETLGSRIKRFNLGLVELSQRTGVSIVDVDRIVARHGADLMKHDAVHLTPDAYRLLAYEVATIFEEMGMLEGAVA